jgi:hypothetical protein
MIRRRKLTFWFQSELGSPVGAPSGYGPPSVASGGVIRKPVPSVTESAGSGRTRTFSFGRRPSVSGSPARNRLVKVRFSCDVPPPTDLTNVQFCRHLLEAFLFPNRSGTPQSETPRFETPRFETPHFAILRSETHLLRGHPTLRARSLNTCANRPNTHQRYIVGILRVTGTAPLSLIIMFTNFD